MKTAKIFKLFFPVNGAIAVLLLLVASTASASRSAMSADTVQAKVYRLSSYLQLEGLSFPLPFSRTDPDINMKPFGKSTLLAYPFFSEEFLSSARPAKDEAFSWMGNPKTWQAVSSDHVCRPLLPDTNWNAWALSCFYARVPQYVKATLSVSFSPVYELYMDGIKVLSQETESDTLQPAPRKAVLKLEPGYHVFMMKALYRPTTQEGGHLELSLETSGVPLVLGADVPEYYGLAHYLNAASVRDPQFSARGDYAKLTFTRMDSRTGKPQTVHYLYKTSDFEGGIQARPVMEFRDISQFSFARNVSKYAYLKREGKHLRIYAGEVGQMAEPVYLADESLAGFAWDPQGRYLILQISESAESPRNGLKRIYDPQDQWPYYRTRYGLAKLDLETGSLVPLTYGYRTASLMDISSDGRYLLFQTSEAADTLRQYTFQRVYRMDLTDYSVRELFSTYFGCQASFSPDGSRLLVLGSELTFTDPYRPGAAVPCEGCFIPNDFDEDAFIYDIAGGKAENITEGFGPSLQKGIWEASGSYIYFYADDHDCVNIYAYGVSQKKWIRIPARVDVVESIDVSSSGLLYAGSSIDRPFQAYYLEGNAAKADFASPKIARRTVLVADPQGKELERVVLGSHREWAYPDKDGDSIEAVFYLPPDFDETGKYPCIVYYYAGTTPTPRALSMRYPKTVWASQGYVVLVLQPSGAIGYDREFSARHVNNWGKTVADEIISGVRLFCREHPFVDSTRLGCIGASYGGFMTQLLVTRTDLFAAAVSHAGISSISSYWGEGYWGYLYGSAANAFSFPWNRKDIFVDQSPLFNADKVHTPLLLLHGTSDVNVPIGESYQMFKALRLLGREVAMVTVDGEDHGIVDYAKRWDWEKTILAWFEKYLKGKPLWWDTLYPERRM